MWLWIWLAVVVGCLVIEAITMEMVCIWFLLGSIVALILAGVGVSPLIQIIVAISLSVISLLIFRKMLLKLLKKDTVKTNVEGTIGKQVKLLTAIKEDGFGTVKLNGVVYNARSENSISLDEGTLVELVEMEGNKYIVREVKK